MRPRASVLICDPDREPIGRVNVPGHYIDKAIRGIRQRVPLSEIRTQSGDVANEAYVGFPNTRPGFLFLEAMPDLFGKQVKWFFITNGTGAEYVRRVMMREDAELFRLWINTAEKSPAAVVRFLSDCQTADDYRIALMAMKKAGAEASAKVVGRG